MGKEKYQYKIINLFNKSPVVDFCSIKRITKKNNYTKQLVINLIKKNKIKRLTKGYYTIHDDPSLLVYCFKPAYLGLQDALSYYNIWEQETIPIIITTKKIRQGIRTINNSNVLIRRIDKKYLFGFDYKPVGEFYYPYATLEKTLIDFVYYKIPIDKKIIKSLLRKIDKKKFIQYLRKYPYAIQKKIRILTESS